MIIVISPEKTHSTEISIVTTILERYPLLRFHLRKPEKDTAFLISYLNEIPKHLHKRISVHGNDELKVTFPDISLHATVSIRKSMNEMKSYSSTSFHSAEELLDEGAVFKYFFCSPVFSSISKVDYHPSIEWNIQLLPTELQKSAVALGGVDSSKVKSLADLGFSNIAVLGAVWNDSDPLAAIAKITTTFAHIYEANLEL